MRGRIYLSNSLIGGVIINEGGLENLGNKSKFFPKLHEFKKELGQFRKTFWKLLKIVNGGGTYKWKSLER